MKGGLCESSSLMLKKFFDPSKAQCTGNGSSTTKGRGASSLRAILNFRDDAVDYGVDERPWPALRRLDL
jgi:hypothetical protein